MRVYVAGRTTDAMRVNDTQRELRERGHDITYDWTRNVAEVEADPSRYTEDYARMCAERDWEGVTTADVVVAMAAPGWLGTAIEIGIALQAGVPVLLVGPIERDVVFFTLPGVYRCKLDMDCVRAAEHIFTRSREAALAE